MCQLLQVSAPQCLADWSTLEPVLSAARVQSKQIWHCHDFEIQNDQKKFFFLKHSQKQQIKTRAIS